jgi:hypothetical protein
MKSNQKIIVALAAAITAVGIAGFLMTTKTGRHAVKKLKRKGNKLMAEAQQTIKEINKNYEALKKDIMANCEKESEEPATS